MARLQLFNRYGKVQSDEDSTIHWSQWRDIVMARKRPRRMLVQANTVIKGNSVSFKPKPLYINLSILMRKILNLNVLFSDETLTVVEYENNAAGMIKSWSERFSADEFAQVDRILEELYKRDLPYFSEARA